MEKENECADPMSANDDTPWPGVKGCRKSTSLFESPSWLGTTSLKYRDKSDVSLSPSERQRAEIPLSLI